MKEEALNVACRSYPKGRDWYDLLWYRAQRPPVQPNPGLLQNALDQTETPGTFLASEWMELLVEKLSHTGPEKLLADVAPFLELPEECSLFTRDNLLAAVRGDDSA